MSARTRPGTLRCYVTEQERELIEKKRKLSGTANMSVYLRHMAMEGYILKLDLPELKEVLSLMHRASANINQIAKRLNATGRIYPEDLKDVQEQQERIWQMLRDILIRLEKL